MLTLVGRDEAMDAVSPFAAPPDAPGVDGVDVKEEGGTVVEAGSAAVTFEKNPNFERNDDAGELVSLAKLLGGAVEFGLAAEVSVLRVGSSD